MSSTLTPASPPSASAHPWRRRSVTTLILVVCAALAAMWVYALVFAPDTPRNWLPDRAWAARAQATCTQAQDEIAALPRAETFKDVQPRSEALRRRADVGDQANAIVRAMIATLRADRPADATTQKAVDQWLADYDAYLGARVAHVQEWRNGVDGQFAEPKNPESPNNPQPISIGMDDFAGNNRMAACRVPGDM
jgi:hypothetical protein